MLEISLIPEACSVPKLGKEKLTTATFDEANGVLSPRLSRRFPNAKESLQPTPSGLSYAKAPDTKCLVPTGSASSLLSQLENLISGNGTLSDMVRRSRKACGNGSFPPHNHHRSRMEHQCRRRPPGKCIDSHDHRRYH